MKRLLLQIQLNKYLNSLDKLELLQEEDMLHTLACTRYVCRTLAQKQYKYSFIHEKLEKTN